ncbi:hypothetical protein BgiBS90_037096, partial [Biomphalaria glabrata]
PKTSEGLTITINRTSTRIADQTETDPVYINMACQTSALLKASMKYLQTMLSEFSSPRLQRVELQLLVEPLPVLLTKLLMFPNAQLKLIQFILIWLAKL